MQHSVFTFSGGLIWFFFLGFNILIEYMMKNTMNEHTDVVSVSATSLNDAAEMNSDDERNTAKRFALIAMVLLGSLVFWYVISDRLAPSSSQGAVNAYVTQLSSQVAGQVTSVFVADGEIVESGQPLFHLDNRTFKLAVKQAENELARSIKSTKATAASIMSSQAAVNEARIKLENIKASTNRTLALSKRNLLSSGDADDAKAQLKSAEAAYSKAEASLESSILALGADDESNLDVQAAQIALEKAQLNFEYSMVKAPTHGVVTNMKLAIGQYVAPGNPALTFIDTRGAWISIDLRENQLGNVDIDDEVDVAFDAAPGQIFKGVVRSVAWGIDPGKTSANGLQKNQPSNQWFEPARRIPVHIELIDGLDSWPKQVKAGGKVAAVVYSGGRSNPIAWMSYGLFRIKSILSYLY